MEVTVSARHTEVPERLRLQAEEKIGRLSRYVEGMDRAEVHFTTHRNPRIAEPELCEVTLEGHGHHVRAKVAATDGYVAVDKAVAKLEHQLQKLKTKLQRQRKGGARNGRAAPAPEGLVPDDVVAAAAAAPVAEPPPAPAGDRLPTIVKVKRFATMGMTADEAAQRMDLLGHGFFFFTNLDTGRAAVVYRREDGDIGLIDEAG
ncbi:MAG TPA: ribosome-associated translation inhibitor RaiA [Acidimicrobiales bacterium]|nr:ribosome-associated translation inhibitor RaiA [Acidimicrobiales bacterium]